MRPHNACPLSVAFSTIPSSGTENICHAVRERGHFEESVRRLDREPVCTAPRSTSQLVDRSPTKST